MSYFVLNEAGIENIAHGKDAEELLNELGDKVVVAAKQLAPKLTGYGASTIHHRLSGDQVDILWGPSAYYLYWNELGSGHQPARPFLRPALGAAGG